MSLVEIITYFVLPAIMVAGGYGFARYATTRPEPLSVVRSRNDASEIGGSQPRGAVSRKTPGAAR
ncbi:hypothetical protein ACFQI3_13320 [Hansschlegelia quercus]|uniref:Uncharacterized protein n=1 Tax=Hansschlegelia quercus TaxID=2528245 RepID=A0A4Q9GAL8_9HYPH|nr:hypothetical protein [Hansschlegelia quercus]TBN47964.1 hypothetical protein EYR15_15220 [Hansschlegelia quercus]